MNRFLRWYLGGLYRIAAEKADQRREEAARIRGRVSDLNHVYDREEIWLVLQQADRVDALANWWQGVAELVPARWSRPER